MRARLAWVFVVCGLALAAPGCSAGDDLGDESDDELTTSSMSASTITSEATYNAFSIEGGGLGGAGRSMKYLVDLRTPSQPGTNFVNGNYKVDGKTPQYVKYHYYFAQRKLGITEDVGTFNDSTYFVQNKKFLAGTIQTYKIGRDAKPTYAIQFYPDDIIKEAKVLEAVKIIKGAFKIPGAKLAFVATGPQQTTDSVKSQIEALGVSIYSIDQILGSVNYFPINPGEAWGTLRVFPQNVDDLRPTDIPVFDELPLDLGVVAGAVTKVYQDVTSHVNLKSKERGTPNMVLRDASPTNTVLAPFVDKPVHLKVGKDGFVIEATTDEIVQQKLRDRLSKPWISLDVVNESRLQNYDDMCSANPAGCLALTAHWGGKAVGLGFLANRSVLGRADQSGSASAHFGYDLTPRGFGVPVQMYRDFVAHGPNAAVRQKIDALITAERGGNLSPNERTAYVEAVKSAILVAELPPAIRSAIEGRVAQLLPGVPKLKVRSSSNAEDVPNFDGAGLYDSFSAEPAKPDNADGSCRIEVEQDGAETKAKVKPKTVQCAVKAVYASLWNRRAVEERSFARLDHQTSGMGLSIVPAYDIEDDVAANAVVITRVINSDDIMGYTLSVQQGNNLVTNPLPGTIAQTSIATFADIDRPVRFTMTRHATPAAGQAPLPGSVLPDDKLAEIVSAVQSVEQAYCRAKPGYSATDCKWVAFDNQKERSLDLEVKILANGHLIIKQVREFHGH
jgi:hypothetical protein